MSQDLINRLRHSAMVTKRVEDEAADEVERLERELATERALSFRAQMTELELQRDTAWAQAQLATAWAQAHRLALELECLLLDTKDNAIVSKWWDSGMEALSEYQQLKPGAEEEAEALASVRKAGT